MRTREAAKSFGSMARLGVVATLWLAAPPAGAQTLPPLFPASFTPGVVAESIAVADFNGDGATDLATLRHVFQTDKTFAAILLAQGDGSFVNTGSFLLGLGPMRFVAGDFNGDGKADLARSSSDNGTVGILLGVGDGSFASGGSFFAGSFLRELVVGDFNGDGKQDIAADAGSVFVLLGNGNGGFVSAGSFATGMPSPKMLAVGDFNGDGKQDLSIAYTDTPKDPFSEAGILLGMGDGSFASAGNFNIPGALTKGTAAGDFNADGRHDLALANEGLESADIYLGQSNGTLAFSSRFVFPVVPQSIAAGDVNGDGRLDLVAGNLGSVGILSGQGDGSFAAGGAFVSTGPDFGGPENRVVVGDFNRDGKQDLATTPKGIILLGDGDGGLTVKTTLVVDDPRTVAVGDFNGDDRDDLATTHVTPNGVIIHLGDGNGAFTSRGDVAVGAGPKAVAVDDFNDDGELDLVTAHLSTKTVSSFLGVGDGSFTSVGSVSTPVGGVVALAVGDFNEDDKPDLAAAHSNFPFSGGLTFLEGQGDGSFTDEGSITLDRNAESIAAGDFNGDDHQDLVVATDWASKLTVLLGQGDGSFSVDGTIPMPGPPNSVAVSDVDADGEPDLVTVIRQPSSVVVLLGQGDASFTSSGTFAVPDVAQEAVTADFDGDGNQDVAVSCSSSDWAGSNSVILLLGDGRGSFVTNGSFASGKFPNALALGEFNGDGRPDLATADSESNTVSVLLNQVAIATSVWLDLGSGLPGSKGIPLLTGTGVQAGGEPVSLDLGKANGASLAVLFAGLASTPTPFKGGTLLPVPVAVAVPLTTSAGGTIALPFLWPSNLPSAFSIVYQYGIADGAAVKGVSLSNGLESTTP